MRTIKEFNSKLFKTLNYYVYRLIDPRDNKTFFIGVGKNNDLFDHINDAIKINENNIFENYEDDSFYDLKYPLIKEIYSRGLDVEYEILKFGLELKEANLLRDILIKLFDVDMNKNVIDDYSKVYLDSIANSKGSIKLNTSEYKDSEENPKYILFKVRDEVIKEKGNRYEATRSNWRINTRVAKKYEYALSVSEGIVFEVYKINEWVKEVGIKRRYKFIGEVASDDVRNIFIGKRIPKKYVRKGVGSPFLYSKLK